MPNDPRIPTKEFLESIGLQHKERYLPSSLDESHTILEKLNRMGYDVNQNTTITKEVITKWNEFSTWLDKEFPEDVNKQITDQVNKELTNEKIVNLTKPTINTLVDGKLTEVNKSLSSVTVHLADTVKKNQSGIITPVMLSQETKEQMTGGSVAVVGVNGVLTENLADGVVTARKTDFIEVSKNLFDKGRVLLKKTMDTDGTIIDDASRWLMDYYLPVKAGDIISLPVSSFRVGYYMENFSIVTRSGVSNGKITVLAEPRIRYLKLSGTFNLDKMTMNFGDVLLPYSKYGYEKIRESLLPDPEPIKEVDTEQIKNDVIKSLDWEVSHPAPTIPKLIFQTVETGYRTIKWLSSDGQIVFGNYGNEILQSKDEWTTKQRIGSSPVAVGNGIAAIRELSNGQLIFSTNRDETKGLKSKVFKTVGYDRNNPSTATFKEVLEIGASQANVNNSWGISSYENIVTVSEYGLRDLEGARRVYLSTDFGETFKLIFDQYTLDIPGKPEWTTSAHMHTATYDPYYNRIWVVVGDRPNSATYYSDDLGNTWTFVENSTIVQYTGIMPLPDAVLFGSDRSPNGLHVYKRKSKAEMPVIESLYILNSDEGITNVFQLPFKRDWLPNTPTYFAATGADGSGKSVIIGTINGKRAYLLFEADSTGELSGDISFVLGKTAQGNILADMTSPDIQGTKVIKAKAPDWI